MVALLGLLGFRSVSGAPFWRLIHSFFMCQVNQYITLSETKHCQVTYCKTCKTFSLTFKSCCASFTQPEFNGFRQILEGLTERDYHYDLIGEEKAIVKNPYVCIGFCLTQEETKMIIEAIRESQTLFEAFHIIYQ